jgi:molybdopterin converting factor small subunit
MAEVTILYFGILRDYAGRRSEKMTVEDHFTALDLVKEIAKRHGEKLRDFVLDSHANPRKSLAFAANGDSVSYSALRKLRCEAISEFAILPPISGGTVPKQGKS